LELGEVAGWAALALAAILALLLGIQSQRLSRVERRLRSLGKGLGIGVEDMSLAEIISTQGARLDAAHSGINDLKRAAATLDSSVARSVQYIGLVRYNPFQEAGGDQSFALALLDRHGDGVVVSSLHGRTATRFYAKPVKGGTSALSLSAEEVQAIKQAREGAPAKAPGSVAAPVAQG
jgi:hypothetical protein